MRIGKYLIMAFSLMFILAGCVTKPVYNVQGAPFSSNGQNLSLEQVAAGITEAGYARDWVMERVAENKIRGTQYSRQHKAVIDITFTETNFSINYVDSENLKYKNGNIHTNYNRWIRNLEKDIRIKLSHMAMNG